MCAVLLPHARAVLDLTSDGMWRIAQYLGFSGSYPAARDLFQLIADAHQEDDAYGPEHPDTLAARSSSPSGPGRRGMRPGPATSSPRCCPSASGSWAPSTPTPWPPAPTSPAGPGQAGDAAGARDQFAALLPVSERVLGAEHPDTLTTRANLAYWTGEAGDAAGARDQFAALLPVSERVLGAEHPDTLTARHNLAAGPGRRGMRPGPAISSPRCCPSSSGSWAPSTPTP